LDPLLSEFAAYASAVEKIHDKALARRGVLDSWLNAPTAPSRYGVAHGQTTEAGDWLPSETGKLFVILPEPPLAMIDAPEWPTSALIDLIAFRPDNPTCWWSRTGASVLLNGDAVAKADFFDRPLVIHPDPLAWMVSGGEGVVVLDWSAHLPFYLSGPILAASSLALAERLDQALNHPPPRTKILVSQAEAAE
jgi:hypothetical protein